MQIVENDFSFPREIPSECFRAGVRLSVKACLRHRKQLSWPEAVKVGMVPRGSEDNIDILL